MIKYYFALIVLCFLGACTKSSRQQYNIPDTKLLDFDKQKLAAFNTLSDAIKSNPSNPESYYKRALINLKDDNFKEALVDISRAESLDPNSGEYLYVKAKAQNALNDPKNAIANALSAEAQNYDLPELYTLMADIYSKLGNYGKTQYYLNKAESIYPFFYDIYLTNGKYLAKRGDTLRALYNFKKSIRYNPDDYEGYDQIIKMYNKIRAIDSAYVFNELALKKFPRKKEMVYNKAQILENVGAADSAIKVYRRFMSLAPERLDIYGKIASIYYHRKNYAAAVKTYDQWSEADPENIVPLKKAAILYESQKNYTLAKKYIEKALQVAPDNTNLTAILASYDYQIEAAKRHYVPPPTENYYYKEKKTDQPVEEGTVEEKSIFGNNSDVGPIETIQKRRPMTIGKDTTRN